MKDFPINKVKMKMRRKRRLSRSQQPLNTKLGIACGPAHFFESRWQTGRLKSGLEAKRELLKSE
jgi:hypothetical protein